MSIFGIVEWGWSQHFSTAKALWCPPPSLVIFKSWVKFELFNPYVGKVSYYNNLSDFKMLCSPSNNVHQHLLTFCYYSLSLQSFLYLAWYTTMSILGHYNNFFFAAHLLDIAMGFKTLRTILSSVTHNGKQVSATCKGLKKKIHFVKVLEITCCTENIRMQFIYMIIGLIISAAAHLIHVKPMKLWQSIPTKLMTDKEVLYTIENTSF